MHRRSNYFKPRHLSTAKLDSSPGGYGSIRSDQPRGQIQQSGQRLFSWTSAVPGLPFIIAMGGFFCFLASLAKPPNADLIPRGSSWGDVYTRYHDSERCVNR